MSVLKNIIFDVGNVLIDWNKEHLSQLIFDNSEEQKIAFDFVFNNPDWFEGDKGILSMQEFELLLAKNLSKCYHYIVRKSLENFSSVVHINEQVNNWGIEKAEQGFNIYLLTNFNQYFTRTLHRIPLKNYIKGYVCSSDVKAIKPDKKIFNELTYKYSLKPQESLFIDDSPINVKAAISLGFQTICFDGNINTLSDFKLIK